MSTVSEEGHSSRVPTRVGTPTAWSRLLLWTRRAVPHGQRGPAKPPPVLAAEEPDPKTLIDVASDGYD